MHASWVHRACVTEKKYILVNVLKYYFYFPKFLISHILINIKIYLVSKHMLINHNPSLFNIFLTYNLISSLGSTRVL